MSREPLVVVEDLRKSYGDYNVLDGVSFTVDPGTVTVLAGANGAGKTTLLRCLAGLARFAGSATICGVPVVREGPSRKLVGYVPQNVQLPETATIAEVVRLFAGLRGVAPVVHGLPDGFLPPAERTIGTLSGGQRQRVVLAAALLGDPLLLLLDEPSANLDTVSRDALWDFVRLRAACGTATLVTRPARETDERLGDREVVLDAGRIRAVRPELYSVSRYTEIGA